MPIYSNDGSNNKPIQPIYSNDATVNREIKEAYANDGTVNRLVYSGTEKFVIVGSNPNYVGGFHISEYLNKGTQAKAVGNTSQMSVVAQSSADGEWPFTVASVSTTSPIDFTKYDKIIVTWYHYGRDGYITHGGAYLGAAWSANWSDNGNQYANGTMIPGYFITVRGPRDSSSGSQPLPSDLEVYGNGITTNTIDIRGLRSMSFEPGKEPKYLQLTATSGAWGTDAWHGHGVISELYLLKE